LKILSAIGHDAIRLGANLHEINRLFQAGKFGQIELLQTSGGPGAAADKQRGCVFIGRHRRPGNTGRVGQQDLDNSTIISLAGEQPHGSLRSGKNFGHIPYRRWQTPRRHEKPNCYACIGSTDASARTAVNEQPDYAGAGRPVRHPQVNSHNTPTQTPLTPAKSIFGSKGCL
jgi:hypothetical protein